MPGSGQVLSCLLKNGPALRLGLLGDELLAGLQQCPAHVATELAGKDCEPQNEGNRPEGRQEIVGFAVVRVDGLLHCEVQRQRSHQAERQQPFPAGQPVVQQQPPEEIRCAGVMLRITPEVPQLLADTGPVQRLPGCEVDSKVPVGELLGPGSVPCLAQLLKFGGIVRNLVGAVQGAKLPGVVEVREEFGKLNAFVAQEQSGDEQYGRGVHEQGQEGEAQSGQGQQVDGVLDVVNVGCRQT